MKEYDETKYRLVPIGEIEVGDAVICNDPSPDPDHLTSGEIYQVMAIDKHDQMVLENDSGGCIQYCPTWAFDHAPEDSPNNWVEYQKSLQAKS